MKNYYEIKERITAAWDNNLTERAKDIGDGDDKTYINVIVPHVINLLNNHFTSSIDVLDIGCGCGYLTNILSKNHPNITGIDISKISIEYAQKNRTGKVNYEQP